MKNGSTLFLKLVILLIAILVLAWLIIFPRLEGRAANLDLISIYKDPLIVYGYVASLPFFVGLFQAFKLLGNIEKNKAFSKSSVNSLKTIKYCALTIIGFIIIGEIWISQVPGDDKAGPFALGIYLTFACAVVAAASSVFEKLLAKVAK